MAQRIITAIVIGVVTAILVYVVGVVLGAFDSLERAGDYVCKFAPLLGLLAALYSYFSGRTQV